MRHKFSQLFLLAAIALLTVAPNALAQSTSASLASLPEADVLIYFNPQRIFNDAIPRINPPADVAKMREVFANLKQSAGFDPSSIEYLVIAVRFNKPATDLSFVAPDVMAVAGGDFSSDSLLTLTQIYLQEKVRVEKHGSKSISLMTIDPIVAQAQKTPMLKPYTEIGIVPLTANSLAIGNLRYLKSAIDATDGTGRINPVALQSLMRDPNVLIAAQGAPIAAIAKSLGMYGLENTSRESSCTTDLGNFYAAVTIDGTNFSLRGAMHADNPDTAKIFYHLISGLMEQGIDAVPDKQAQTILKSLKMSTRENEIVWEADVPQSVVADFIKPKPTPAATSKPATPKPAARPPARKKRTR